MAEDLTDYEYLKENPSEFVRRIIGVDPFEYQAEFMDNDSTRKAFVSGRQVGKSRTASWMALHYAVTHPDSLVLVTADALRQSSELFTQLRSEMNNAGITDDQWGVKRDTQTTVEFEHGSRIKVVPTGRSGNKIRGFTADYIIVDEAAFVDDQIFEDVIEPMTFVTDGTIVLCSTPYGTSGYFYDKATHPDWHSTWDPDTGGISSYDNPEIDEEKIEEYKRGKTKDQIMREVEGNFVEAGDAFFPPDLIRGSMHTSVGKSGSTVYAGIDPSGEGSAESVIAMVDDRGNVFKIEDHNSTLPDLRRRVQALDNHYDFETINVDRGGVGEGFVAELSERIGRRTVNDVFLTTQKKQDVYQNFKAKLQNDEVHLSHDEDLKAQMENLGFSTTQNGTLKIQPKDDTLNDDFPDAVALAVWAMPGVAGSGTKGARGMTSSKTIGQLSEDSNGKRRYTFEDQDDEAEQYMSKSFVGSKSIRTGRD